MNAIVSPCSAHGPVSPMDSLGTTPPANRRPSSIHFVCSSAASGGPRVSAINDIPRHAMQRVYTVENKSPVLAARVPEPGWGRNTSFEMFLDYLQTYDFKER